MQVVASTTVTDYFSGTTLTSEYLYHDGYWDGGDREYRGFARVDQRDALTATGTPAVLQPAHRDPHLVSPRPGRPRIRRLDRRAGPDPANTGSRTSRLPRPWTPPPCPPGMNRRGLRYAIRALRGQVLRSELYALDGDPNAGLPYQVTDNAYALDARARRAIAPLTPAGRPRRLSLSGQSLRADRRLGTGREPMTQATFTGGYDDYGRAAPDGGQVALPRGRDPDHLPAGAGAAPYLATCTLTEYATRDDSSHYLINRVSMSQQLESPRTQPSAGPRSSPSVSAADQPANPRTATIRALILTYFDGAAFEGLPSGQLGDWGLRTRVEDLALTPGDPRGRLPGGRSRRPAPALPAARRHRLDGRLPGGLP